MTIATRLILTVIAACVAAIGTRTAVMAICSSGPSCEGYSLGAAGVALVVIGLPAYLAMRRTSSSQTGRDMKRVMAADTAAGGGEFGDGDGGGD